jgi:hypothetical protein
MEWKEYSGADQEGYYLKVLEELKDIARFLDCYLALIMITRSLNRQRTRPKAEF